MATLVAMSINYYLVPGVQDHDAGGGGGVDQAAGEHFQLLVGVPLGLQGEER